MHQKVIEVASEIIRERLQPTSAMIENLVQIELGYINTSHPDFMGPGAAISALGKMHDRRTKLRNNGYNRASSDGKKSKVSRKIADWKFIDALYRSQRVVVVNNDP